MTGAPEQLRRRFPAEVPALEQKGEKGRAGRDGGAGLDRRVATQPGGKPLECGLRLPRGVTERVSVTVMVAGRGKQAIQPRPEKEACPFALAQRPLGPGSGNRARPGAEPGTVVTDVGADGGGGTERLHRPVEKRRRRLETCDHLTEPLPQWRKVPQQQSDDGEDRLAGIERRIAMLKVTGGDLAALNVEEPGSDVVIEHVERSCFDARASWRRPRLDACRGVCREDTSQIVARSPHVVGEGGETVRRPVRQAVVVGVHAGERRIHRTPAKVVIEEAVERRHAIRYPSSGSETHRRSRYDRSTALMVSCTQAASSKSPSVPRCGSRISSRKLLIRLA